MRRATSIYLKAMIAGAIIVGGTSVMVAAGPGVGIRPASRPAMRFNYSPAVQSYYYPSYGGYGGYYSPFVSVPSIGSTNPYLPNYWWTGRYPTADPRQAGYNPSAGYKWEDVTTLILATSPKKALVILDGSPIGSADDLGPIQLPVGDHTLRVEAPGFQPSETVMKVQTPSLQRLQISLKASGPNVAAMAPR
jgi:PEGA domain